MKLNYCTAVITVNPEVDDHDGLTVKFWCKKGLNLVRGCRHYHPMRCADGTICKGECQHFANGCRSKSARNEARIRAKRIVKTWITS